MYFQFPGLCRHQGLVHAVFTRLGGVSKPPYGSLNTSYSTGDQPERVTQNLRLIKGVIGTEHLIFMNQRHGKEVLVLRQGESWEMREPPGVDAIITDIPNLAIMVKQADCQGVILFDPIKHVLSIVHCGWRGSISNILASVVSLMRSEFKCRESDLTAAIGPSLGPCCSEFVTYEELFPRHFRRFMCRENHFDLWEISRWQLLGAGIEEQRIDVAGLCTRCRTDVFFSYRAEGVTGRFGTVAMLKEK